VLDARHWFSISAGNAKDDAHGRATNCRDARIQRPFVGNWTRPGQSRPSGQRLCTYQRSGVGAGGIATREWTVNGQPIIASLLYSAGDRRTAVDEADLVWQRATH
jgi:hypothetical protein